jgi:ribosomal protein L34
MPVGMFRSDEGWVQVDYGTGNAALSPRKGSKRTDPASVGFRVRSISRRGRTILAFDGSPVAFAQSEPFTGIENAAS